MWKSQFRWNLIKEQKYVSNKIKPHGHLIHLEQCLDHENLKTSEIAKRLHMEKPIL